MIRALPRGRPRRARSRWAARTSAQRPDMPLAHLHARLPGARARRPRGGGRRGARRRVALAARRTRRASALLGVVPDRGRPRPAKRSALLEPYAAAAAPDLDVLTARGMALAALGRRRRGAGHLRARARRPIPRTRWCWSTRAPCTCMAGDAEPRAARPSRPRSTWTRGVARAHNSLGVIAARQGRLEEAVERWKRAVALDPRDYQTLFNLGSVLRGQGRAAEARPYLEALPARGPARPRGARHRAGARVAGRRRLERARAPGLAAGRWPRPPPASSSGAARAAARRARRPAPSPRRPSSSSRSTRCAPTGCRLRLRPRARRPRSTRWPRGRRLRGRLQPLPADAARARLALHRPAPAAPRRARQHRASRWRPRSRTLADALPQAGGCDTGAAVSAYVLRRADRASRAGFDCVRRRHRAGRAPTSRSAASSATARWRWTSLAGWIEAPGRPALLRLPPSVRAAHALDAAARPPRSRPSLRRRGGLRGRAGGAASWRGCARRACSTGRWWP